MLMVFWKKKTICNGSDSWETMFSTSINSIVNAKARNQTSRIKSSERTLIQEKKSHGHQFASFRFVSWQFFLILLAIFP